MLKNKGPLCINKLEDRSETEKAQGEYTFRNPENKVSSSKKQQPTTGAFFIPNTDLFSHLLQKTYKICSVCCLIGRKDNLL